MSARTTTKILFLAAAAFVVALLPIALSSQIRLVPARDVVELREVWRREGVRFTDDEWGRQTWGGTDLNGDSIADFGVYRGSTNEWYFFAGGPQPDTAAMWVIDSVTNPRPWVGNLFGDDRLIQVFRWGYALTIDDFTYYYDVAKLFEVDRENARVVPLSSLDYGARDIPVERYIDDIVMADLDHDGDDDLAYVLRGVRFGQQRTGFDGRNQIWIYLGGSDFSLEEPDLILYDTGVAGSSANSTVEFRDFDGDGFIDLMTGGAYPDFGEGLRFYWGDANSPQSWTERDFDRTVKLVHGIHGINSHADLNFFDADGDGAVDFGSREYDDQYGSRLYLSGSGKSVRTRSFELDDADRFYENALINPGIIAGPINDSSGRYDAILFWWIDPASTAEFIVSGGAWGPDHDYDAVIPSLGSATASGRHSSNVGDVTGDGWSDFLGEQYQLQGGISILYAGGPYIPFDDPTVSVRTEAVAGDPRGLYLWPNPVEDVLRIAWKGNLDRMPVRYEVYDAGGRTVGSGDLDSWKGSGEWRCAGMSAGAYRIAIFDHRNELLTTSTIQVLR